MHVAFFFQVETFVRRAHKRFSIFCKALTDILDHWPHGFETNRKLYEKISTLTERIQELRDKMKFAVVSDHLVFIDLATPSVSMSFKVCLISSLSAVFSRPSSRVNEVLLSSQSRIIKRENLLCLFWI